VVQRIGSGQHFPERVVCVVPGWGGAVGQWNGSTGDIAAGIIGVVGGISVCVGALRLFPFASKTKLPPEAAPQESQVGPETPIMTLIDPVYPYVKVLLLPKGFQKRWGTGNYQHSRITSIWS